MNLSDQRPFLEPDSRDLRYKWRSLLVYKSPAHFVLDAGLRFSLLLSALWTLCSQRGLDLATMTQQLSGGLLMKTHKAGNCSRNWTNPQPLSAAYICVTLVLKSKQLDSCWNLSKYCKMLGEALGSLWPCGLWPWANPTNKIYISICCWISRCCVWCLFREKLWE